MSTINQFGYTRDTLQQIIDNLKDKFRTIYGADLVLSDTDPDSQMINIFANAIESVEGLLQDFVNNLDIDSSTGSCLSSVVSYRNTKRKPATKSTVDLLITSTAPSMTFPAGLIFADAKSQRWIIPSSFSTDATSTVTVTAYAPDFGAITTPANSVTTIITPTFGFASVTNPSLPTAGRLEESDYALKIRSRKTTAVASQGMVDSIYSAIANVTGVVGDPIVIENDTNSTISHGTFDVLAHSVGVAVYGGNVADIVEAIYKTKASGCGTGFYQVGVLEPNNVSSIRIGSNGSPFIINFSRPTLTGLDVQFELPIGQAPDITTQQAKILQAVQEFAEQTAINEDVSHIDVSRYVYDVVGYFYSKEIRIKSTAGVYSSTANAGDLGTFVGSLSTVNFIYT